MSGDNLIYKYTSLTEFTFKNLLLSQLWFNPPDLMNDQLEGLVKVKNSDFEPSERAIDNFIESNRLYDFYLDPKHTIKNSGFLDFYMTYWFRHELDKFRISCFSINPTESLMWAHYANKHSGLCLIYDKKKLLKSLKLYNGNFEMISIQYGVKPTITIYEEKEQIRYITDIPIISTKDKNWKYENEIRFFIADRYENESPNGKSVFIENSALKGIIYGYQMSESDKDAISMIIRNEPHYSRVKEYNEVIDFKTGKIIIGPD